MIKVVYAEGCSITAGAEHKDWQMRGELEYSQTTWAGQIHKLCFPNAKYFPTARSGASQSHIRRRALFYLNELLNKYKPEYSTGYITMEELNIAFKRMKNGKACGPDERAGETIRHLPKQY